MAFKSPGIYFTEIDNTEYTNPAAEINTTVAIIGFAKKGPIGEPTEINSYSDFKSIFGTPISGTYAGIAVRSVLSAGGTVLYVRIADESLASKSNVIIKNKSETTPGALIINNKNAITVGSVINGKTFVNGELYASNIASSEDEETTKTVMLRTPASGRFTLSDMIEQFDKGLKDQFGFTEFSFRTPKAQSYKVFSAKTSNNKESEMGPYFVELSKNEKPELVIKAINNSISKGTNPYQIFKFNPFYGYNNKEAIVNGSGTPNAISFDTSDIVSTAKYTINNEGKTFRFCVKKANLDEPIVLKIEIPSKDSITLQELAKIIDDVLVDKNTGIRCRFIYDKSTTDAITLNSLGLLFFSIDYVSFSILPFYNKDSQTYKGTLFIPKPIGSETGYLNGYPYAIINGEPSNGAELKLSDEEQKAKVEEFGFVFDTNMGVASSYENMTDGAYFDAEYNNYTNSIIFNVLPTAKEKIAKDTTIVIKDYDFNVDNNNLNYEFLFERSLESLSSDEKPTAAYTNIATQNKNSLGRNIRSYTGQSGLGDKVSITRGSDQRVYIKQSNGVDAPIVSTVKNSNGNNVYTYELTDLFGPQITEKQFENLKYTVGKDSVLIQHDGSIGTDAANEDMIIFTAKEFGSGTNNIGIEIYTSVSPIDDSKTHFIDIYVDGIKKEGWEEVSYNPNNDNYFETLINDEPENGGSSYVKVSVKRGNKIADAVNVPDTTSLTSTGVVYLGTAINDDSVSFYNSTAEKDSDYQYYDYKLGNDGKPSGDPSDLFMAAMDTETSGLSNKDLYSWHILITPDDGQREEIQDEAIKLCEFMEDAIYIADPPQGLSRDGVIKWHNGASQQRTTPLQSNYCCTYWPWLKIYNAIESKYQYVQPSIIMAAQFCKVDNSYAPWYAPAGATNGYCSTALDLEVNSKDKRYPNKTDRDNLYLDQNRINPFLKLRNGNILAYGEKTCQRKNSTLTKIHTRRMLIALKKDLTAAIKGFIFQPTVGENINKIRNNVTTIMETYKTGGAVDSYVVDTSMNTTETLQQDILYIAISCVPVGCIEQVEITFTLNKSAE